jgi:polyphosphate kinase
MTRAAALCCLLVSLQPGEPAAHPHVFVDTGARFVVTEGERFTAIEIEHRYDALFSLFVLNDLGVGLSTSLPEAITRRLVEDNRTMLSAEGSFAALDMDGEDIALGLPEDIAVDLVDDRLRVTFRLPLKSARAMSGHSATLAVFDPSYLIAFDLTGGVSLTGTTVCTVEKVEWAPEAGFSALWSTLFDLESNPVPLDFNAARMSAAKARLTCR